MFIQLNLPKPQSPIITSLSKNDKKYKVKIKEPQTAYSILLNKDNDKYVAGM